MPEFSLEELGLVDAPDEEVFDNLTHLASYITGTPVSLISFVQPEKNRQYFKSQVGLAEPWLGKRQVPLSHSFSQYVVRENAMLIIDNASEHPLVADNLAIPYLGVCAYLGAPIYGTTDSTPLGALCVVEGEPRKWDDEAIKNLEKLAYCVTDAIRTKILYKNSENMRNEQRDFTYAISHDLKAPLTTVSYLVDEVRKSSKSQFSDDTLQLLQLLDSTVLRSKILIEDVLNYTRALQNSYDLESVDLNKLFQEIRDNLKGDIEQSGATINIQKLPIVKGSPMQLKLLFQNIVQNAIKYSKTDVKPLVNITAITDKGRNDINISDNGIGISPEYHSKIFKLFERLHTQDEHTGSGLGLAIAHRIATNHGGSIDVESSPLEGTTFKVRLGESK